MEGGAKVKFIKTLWLLPVLAMDAYMWGFPTMDQRQAEAAESGKPDRISIAYCVDCVQFHFQDKDGNAAGLIIDMWRLWSKRTGIAIDFKAATWEETLKMVGEGRADAHAGLFFNEERAKFLEYGTSLTKTDTQFFVHKSLPGIEKMENLTAYKVGVLSGDYVEGFLKKKLPPENIVGFESYEAIMEALRDGKLQVFAADTPTGVFHLQKAGLGYVFEAPASKPLYTQKWFVAATKGNVDLIKVINAGMALVSNEERREIERRWASISDPGSLDTEKEEKRLNLTVQERQWLADYPVIRVHNETDWPPFNFFEDGESRGFSIDYMNLLASMIGVKVDYATGPTWNEFLGMMKSGDLDVMLNIVKTPERQKYLLYTKPYAYNPNSILSRKDAPYNDLQQLIGKTVALPKGFFYEEILKRDYPRIKLHLVKDVSESMKAVVFGKADAALGELAVFNYLMGREMMSGLVLSGEVDLGGSNYSQLNVATRKDLPVLASILRKAMAAVSPEEVKVLRRRWVDVTATAVPQRPKLKLTEAEKAWLAEHKYIRLGVDPDYPPFDFVGEDGTYSGMASDYVRLISERLGIAMEVVPDLSWEQVVNRMKERTIDVLPAAAKTPEREPFMSFSRPYIAFPVIIVTREDYSFISGLDDLNGRKVALMKGYAVTGRIETQNPGIERHLFGLPLQALRAVAVGEADATVLNLAVATYLIKKHNLTNLKVASPSGIELPGQSFAVRKDWPELVGILDKALASITPEEESAIRSKWVSVQYKTGIDMETVLEAGGVGTIIVLVIVLWNRRLQREVKQRKLAEKKMEAAKNEAERLTQAKSDFIAVISHEIRTHMNGVLGMARLLAEMKLNREQQECVHTIVDSGETLLTIIDDLLDISKLDAGKLEIENLPFIVDEAVEQAMALMKLRADEKGLALNSVIDAQIPSVVVGEPLRLRQIILNLVSNAIKFTEKGSITVEARMESQTDDAVVLSFTVTDTGKGIPPEALEKLFFAYSQGSAEVTRKYGGTGLGLAICRRLADLMDGEITVESTVGKGSAFRFKANFEIDKTTDVALLRKKQTADRPSPANKRTTRSLRVLQVEDNKTNRTVIERILSRVGHSVSSVENGEKSLEALKSGDFDVSLMDRHMPVMDGLEATRRIREMDGPVASIPIYGITASASQSEIDACIEAGMNDCFTKPVEAVKLRSLLENLGSGNKSPSPAPTPSIDDGDQISINPDQPPIDLGRLSTIIGDDDDDELFFLLNIFNNEFPKLLGNLEMAIQERDARSVHDCAHAAKGAALNAGALVLSGILKKIEADAHLENWDETKERTGAVKSEHARIVRFCNDRQ